MMSLTVPVSDLGAFILDIDPSRFLFPYLAAWPGSSRTAESLLTRREGTDVVYLNPTRQTPRLAPFSRRPLTRTVPPDEVLDTGWSLAGTDYRGVRVLGTIRRVPDSDWYLLCNIDVDEVVAPLHRLGWEMGLITALIGLANAAGAGLIWRVQQARISRQREAWFQSVANDTPAYLWMASVGQENSFVNRPLRKFLGTGTESLSKSWAEYVHPDDAARTRSSWRPWRKAAVTPPSSESAASTESTAWW
jgi:hypothetical protein